MPRYLAVIIAGLLLTVCACDDSTGPGRRDDFSFQLTVKTPEGVPVPGLEAKLTVPVVTEPSAAGALARALGEKTAATKVEVDLPVQARLHVQFLDLRKHLVRDLYDAVVPAGRFSVLFDGRNDAGEDLLGTVALWCRVRTFDPQSNTRLFADSTLAVLYERDALSRPLLGTTDADGTVRSTDPLLFPGLFNLGTLTWLDETGQEVGTFTISDDVDVYLYGTLGEVEVYKRVTLTVGPGRNRFEVVWGPAAASPAEGSATAGAPDRPRAPALSRAAGERAGALSLPPPTWRMVVYPNPFD